MLLRLDVSVVVVALVLHLLNKDGTVHAAANSGVVPQAFIDFLRQQEQQASPVQPSAAAKAPSPPSGNAPNTPVQSPQSQPLPKSSPQAPQAPSTQQLQQFQQLLKQQQQHLDGLKRRLEQQKRQQQLPGKKTPQQLQQAKLLQEVRRRMQQHLQQQQQQQQQQLKAPQPPRSLSPPQPPQQTPPKQPIGYQEHRDPFQKHNHQSGMQSQQPPPPGMFGPPPPPGPQHGNHLLSHQQFPPQPPGPTPPPRPVIATTRQGIIDFVPPEHRALQPYEPPLPPVNPNWPPRPIRQGQYPSPTARSSRRWTPAMQNMAYQAVLRARYAASRPRVQKRVHPFANMPMPKELQKNAMSMGRQMCLTQYYESHGCIDPVAYLPPGTVSQGLVNSCTSMSSQQLCSYAGSRVPGASAAKGSNMQMMMMMRMSSSSSMLENCLTPNTVMKAMTSMMSGRSGPMNPATMMMMMGGGGEAAGGGMAALTMMNMMKQGSSRTASRGSRVKGQGDSIPSGAASPWGTTPSAGRRSGQTESDKCMAILPLLAAQGGEGGMFSPEGANTVIKIRKQMLPYTCQDISYGVYFRMCCPGKVPPPPGLMQMMTSCGGM